MDVTVEDAQQGSQELDEVHVRIAPRFVRAEPRQRARAYLQGLLSWSNAKIAGNWRKKRGKERPMGCNAY